MIGFTFSHCTGSLPLEHLWKQPQSAMGHLTNSAGWGLGQAPEKSNTCFLIQAPKTIKICLYKPEQISEERLEGYCILVVKILLQIKKRKRPKLEEEIKLSNFLIFELLICWHFSASFMEVLDFMDFSQFFMEDTIWCGLLTYLQKYPVELSSLKVHYTLS